MKKILIITCAVVLLASCKDKKSGAAKVPLKNLKDSFSYAYGAYVGSMLHSTNIKDIDWTLFKASYDEAIKHGDSGLMLDKEKINEVLNKYSLEAKFGENKKKGQDYIAKHKGDYKVTPSGLLFKQLKAGNGVKPLITDTVMVHYTGKFIDGKVFDSNIGKDAFKTSMNAGAIKGFLEALSMMEVGSEAEVVIPYELAYGSEGNRNPYTGEMQMEPYQTLIFTLTLDEIKK